MNKIKEWIEAVMIVTGLFIILIVGGVLVTTIFISMFVLICVAVIIDIVMSIVRFIRDCFKL